MDQDTVGNYEPALTSYQIDQSNHEINNLDRRASNTFVFLYISGLSKGNFNYGRLVFLIPLLLAQHLARKRQKQIFKSLVRLDQSLNHEVQIP